MTPSSNACAKATWCRCASSPRAAAPGVRELLDIAEKLLPASGRSQSAAVRQRHAATTRAPIERDARSEGARHRRRLQDRQRSLRRQARRFPRLPGHGAQGHAAVHRRRQEAVQGRAPVQAQGQGPRRDRAGDPRRHRRGRQGRRAAFRRRAARQPRRGPDPPRAAGFPEADVRPRGRGRAQGPGAEARRRAAQAGRGRSGVRGRAQHGAQRDRAARAVATCTCG